MLAHKNRIIKKEDFARIKRYGHSYFSGSVELKIAENQAQRARIGLVIGMQFSKKAVERNKTRRWARETLRSYLPKIAKNKDLLVIIKKTSGITKKNHIKEDIKRVLEKAGIND